MERFYSPQTDDCPEIILDKSENNFLLRGKSLPEDVNSFYAPVLEWLENYARNPNEKTSLDFMLSYFNTASSKLILDILLILEEISNGGRKVQVNWHYPEYDEDLHQAGLEYSEMVSIPFSYLPDPAAK